MKLVVEISTDNTDQGTEAIRRMLNGIKAELIDGRESGIVRDLNGNRVGTWEYTPGTEED